MSVNPPPRRPIQDWQIAEVNAAAWMQHWGFHDAQVTNSGPDGGVDVRSSRALAQVKMQGRSAGRREIQNLVGARGLEHHKALLFFCNAGYASTAVDEAARSGVALFQYDIATGEMFAVNAHGRALIDNATPTPTAHELRLPPPREGSSVGAGSSCLAVIAIFLFIATVLSSIGGTTSWSVPVIWAFVALVSWVVGSVRVRRDNARNPSVHERVRSRQPQRRPDSPADIDWYDFRASPEALAEGLARVHQGGRGEGPPAFERVDDAHFRITFPLHARYTRSLTADLAWLNYGRDGLVRVYWSTYSQATPETGTRAAEVAHQICASANAVLATVLGEPVAHGRW